MDYVPIRVSTLRGDEKIDFGAYVKINEKYVLYIKQGDSFEGERLKRLKEKKLKKMFILPESESTYRTYLARNIEMAYDTKSSKNLTVRSEIVQGAQQSNAEEVFENVDSVEAYNSAKDAAGRFVQFLTTQDEALANILNIDNVDQNIAHHGVSVSSLAVALASKLNIVDEKQIQLLALGSLLHDFGHFNTDLNINKPVKDFTKEELAKYHAHPKSGAETVQTKKHFDQAVINIIMQHEECINGGGYPQKLLEKQIDPLALICGTANALDRLITFEGIPKKDGIKNLTINSVGKYPLNYLTLLKEVAAKAYGTK